MIGKKIRERKHITPNRIIALGFASIIFVGAFLLCLPIAHNDKQWFPFIDAFFTATSSVCVTGLIVVDTATKFSLFGQLVILLLIQIGGLGVMTATTLLFLMMRKRITLKNRLLMQEALAEDRLQGIVQNIKRILIMTFIIELIGALILMCSFIPRYGAYGIYVSIFTAISAFCNAGFDILGVLETPMGSMTPFVENAFVCLPIMALIVTGGIGFMVMNDIHRSVWRKKRLNISTKIVLGTTLVLIILSWIIFACVEWNHSLKDLSVGGKLLASLFQSVTPRTAGFNSIDLTTMTPVSYIVTIILMFIGASPSSTGGGVKTTTIAVLIIVAIRTLQGEQDVNIRRSKVNFMTVRKALTIIIFSISYVIITTIFIVAFEGNKLGENIFPVQVFYEVISAFATVGLSLGITPELGIASKLLLCLTMFVGRVGTLTIGFSLLKHGKEGNKKIEYTDAKILIG